jgi:hypothetical protein
MKRIIASSVSSTRSEVCLFYMSGWSKGPVSYIYRPSASRRSSDQTDVFVDKGNSFCFFYFGTPPGRPSGGPGPCSGYL